MNKSVLASTLAVLLAAPAAAATVTLAPAIVAEQNPLPTLVTACASPDKAAQVVGDAFFEVPTIAKEQGITGISTVKIQLDANGSLVSQQLFASSGNPWLDGAALQSARVTHFAPEVRECRRTGGTYLYAVQY